MKRLILAALLANIFCSVSFPQEQKVLLRWKVDNVLTFEETSYDAVNNTSFDKSVISEFFRKSSDSIPDLKFSFPTPKKTYYILKNTGNDVINIKGIVDEVEDNKGSTPDSIYDKFKQFYTIEPVQIRAEINNGRESFLLS